MDVIFISHIFPLFSKSGETNFLLNCPQYIQRTLKLYFEKTGFPIFWNYRKIIRKFITARSSGIHHANLAVSC